MPPSNPSAVSGVLAQRSETPLETHIHCSSVKGLESITTLIVGAQTCVIIDPPFLLPDGKSVVEWVKRTTDKPVGAIFVSHHHPDHYMAANPILEAWPEASFLAAPYVRAGIDREYDEKVKFWPTVFGDDVAKTPARPEPYPFSFFILPGNTNSPVFLVGPVQGDSVDHSMFWLPRERTIITGDCMYGPSVQVWAEEIETPQILEAWRNVLDLIEGLEPVKIIPGHKSSHDQLDKTRDLQYNRDYLKLFADKITYAAQTPEVKELYSTFESAFPDAKNNLDFFLGHLSNQFGKGGQVWEENKHHNVGARTSAGLDGYVIGNAAKLSKQ